MKMQVWAKTDKGDIYLDSFALFNEIGDHSKFYLKIDSDLNGISLIEDSFKNKCIDFRIIDLNGESHIYSGLIVNKIIQKSNEATYFKIEGGSKSLLMDIKKVIFSYKDIFLENLLSELLNTYPTVDYKIELLDNPFIKYIVKYDETDWHFLKRVCDRYSLIIINNDKLIIKSIKTVTTSGDCKELTKNEIKKLRIKENILSALTCKIICDTFKFKLLDDIIVEYDSLLPVFKIYESSVIFKDRQMKISYSGVMADEFNEFINNQNYGYKVDSAIKVKNQLGMVTAINDPLNKGRVKVRLLWQEKDNLETNWILPKMQFSGFWWKPEINDNVIIGYLNDNIDDPFVLGSLKEMGGERDDNSLKIISSRGRLMLIFDDKKENESLSIKDFTGNSIKLNSASKSIEINSPEEIVLNSKKITLRGKEKIEVLSDDSLNMKGTKRSEIRSNEIINIQANKMIEIISKKDFLVEAFNNFKLRSKEDLLLMADGKIDIKSGVRVNVAKK